MRVCIVGECRRFIFADLLCRYLSYRHFKVNHVVNITDLDDRIILGARKQKLPPEAFAAYYIESIFNDLDRLGIQRASHYPRTTEHVSDMIDLTRSLLAKGIAYEKTVRFILIFPVTRIMHVSRVSIWKR